MFKPAAYSVNSRSMFHSKLDENKFQVLENEIVTTVIHNVKVESTLNNNESEIGNINVSNYRLLFIPTKEEEKLKIKPFFIFIGSIRKIVKRKFTENGKSFRHLKIKLNPFGVLKIAFNYENNKKEEMKKIIQDLSVPFSYLKQNLIFQFKQENNDQSYNGWDAYQPYKEFIRMMKIEGPEVEEKYDKFRIKQIKEISFEECDWKWCSYNKGYKICPTYPREFPIIKSLSKKTLNEYANRRSKNRFPVLCWYNHENHNIIMRSSQPMTTFQFKESEIQNDLILVNEMSKSKTIIFDARPKLNAVANMANGGGFETGLDSEKFELQFLDIPNVHAMRKSLKAVWNPNKKSDLSLTDYNHVNVWVDHIKKILRGALQINNIIRNSICSVLVHCTDGWDRTVQLISLSLILLDPYYRTFEGFSVLIEKEWVSFGHKFQSRSGLYGFEECDKQQGPIFYQFIDAVWQLMNQIEDLFEFNEDYLILLLEMLYSGLYGTFSYNSESERKLMKVKSKTESVWTHINMRKEKLTNRLYLAPEDKDINIENLSHLFDPSKCVFWTKFASQFEHIY